MINLRIVALLALALSGLAGPLAAQQQQQGQTPGWMMGQDWMVGQDWMMRRGTMGPGHMTGMGHMMGGPAQHVEGRLAFLKAELRITPAQEQAWNAYAEAYRASAASMQTMHDRMMSGGMPATLPERMQWHEQMMSSRIEALKPLRTATVALYNALDPEQKKRADSLMMGMGMM